MRSGSCSWTQVRQSYGGWSQRWVCRDAIKVLSVRLLLTEGFVRLCTIRPMLIEKSVSSPLHRVWMLRKQVLSPPAFHFQPQMTLKK